MNEKWDSVVEHIGKLLLILLALFAFAIFENGQLDAVPGFIGQFHASRRPSCSNIEAAGLTLIPMLFISFALKNTVQVLWKVVGFWPRVKALLLAFGYAALASLWVLVSGRTFMYWYFRVVELFEI